MTDLPLQNLDLVKGETTYFDIDLSVDLDAGDEVWFTAKHRKSDVDGDAVIAKTRTGGGIEVVSGSEGTARVKVEPLDSVNITVRALVYDLKVKKVDAVPDAIQTAAHGVIRCVDSVNKSAA